MRAKPESFRLFRNLSIVFAVSSVLPTVGALLFLSIGGDRGEFCRWHDRIAPSLGEIPHIDGSYCVPQLGTLVPFWLFWTGAMFAILATLYVLFVGLSVWANARIAERTSDESANAPPDRSSVSSPISQDHRESIRVKRHLVLLAVIVLVVSSLWIGDRLVDGKVGADFLCASKVATAQFGDVPMLDGGYCRPRWGSAIGVFLTLSVVLFVALSIAYFVFYFIPVSLHRALLRLEREAESDRYATD